jgi:protein phosphatase
MSNTERTIQCSNPHCLAINGIDNQFCHRCKTPIVKRYLWATAQAIAEKQLGQLIGDRYLALERRVFLDTQPGKLPQTAEEAPKEIIAYLQLFSYAPHIPQVYGQLDGTDIWLLEYGTVPTDERGELIYPQLIPEITEVWQQATAIQQLNWLRQIVTLWQPLASKQLVSSLLNSQLIRVNGSLIQLLQLEPELATPPRLKSLAKLWSQWLETASPLIQELLAQLCLRIEQETISHPEQIIAVLDQAIRLCSYAFDYSYQVVACTDPGPSRSHNEDASYPANETLINLGQQETSLAIVCDGVGGHEGGEIAAEQTIRYLRDRVAELSLDKYDTIPAQVIKKLANFTNAANDLISNRNDNEQRQERQRMGTTLVMSLAHQHEMYLTHVGDSRIYLITPESCHQVTIDDDLASREVRLGYAIYREALQYPSSGALIQALGMRDSNSLHPNVQRLIIDRDCVFLLCTDGLSDFDRVEQYWQGTILPILNHPNQNNLIKAAKALIKIANEKNGHDNVTVALVHCQVKPKSETKTEAISWLEVEPVLKESISWFEADLIDASLPNTESLQVPEEQLTEAIPSPAKSKRLQLFLLSLIILIGVGVLSSLFVLKLMNQAEDSKELPPTIPNQESITPSSGELQN